MESESYREPEPFEALVFAVQTNLKSTDLRGLTTIRFLYKLLVSKL